VSRFANTSRIMDARHRVAWWRNCLRPVASQNLVCAAAAVRRNRSPRPSGYARPFRFAKEFGPDQVLRSDKFEPQERSTYSEAHSRPGAATTRTSELATNIRTRNKLLKRHLPDRQLDAVLSFRGLLLHVLRQER
jgi:hypothetical protein